MQFKKETYSSKAAEFIKNLIRSGELLPGQPVREALISERLNISRAPIREALLLLAQQGLICSEPQKGKFVRSMSAQEIYDSYAVAGILEGAGATQSIALWTEKEEGAFLEIVRRLDEQVNYAVSLDTLTEIDEAFHAALLSACTNRHLIELAHSSSSSLAKFLYYNYWRTMYTPQEFRERHHVVANAVLSRDSQRIEKALRQHYEDVGLRLCELVHDA
ncbi:MAG: GntR family transcriptional regulator [Mailhella sp.]|nr:GntR family transcriptional regulator [Mailhella sp.]